MDCSICCFTFNKSSKKAIECLKCNNLTCSTCIKKYLSSTIEDPHCMHCKHAWDLFFTNKVLSRNYMTKEWKISRSNLLFNREKSFFPETMPLVAAEIEKENLLNEIVNIEKTIRELNHRKTLVHQRIYQIERGHIQATDDKKNNFNIRQCPFNDCKGFLNGKGFCMICNQNSCLKCNTVKKIDEEHECKESDIDTWQEIIKSSKPCPNCGTRIQKVSGCAQMWCPGCHVAFNWNTGKIEKGIVHNPHYYEWAERLGLNMNNHNNNPCDNNRLVWNYYNYASVKYEDRVKFRNLHQKLNHIIHNDLVNLQTKTNRNNIDLRIKYIRNQISEEHYKKILMKREIQHQKDVRLVDTLDTFNTIIIPILANFMNKTIDFKTLTSNIKELEKFINDNIDEINITFNSHIAHFIII